MPEVFITYSQLAVFDAALDDPFNDWTDAHVDQGFAWRFGSVSFGTLRDGVDMEVTIQAKRTFASSPGSARTIRVPFTVPEPGDIEVASISGGFRARLPPGDYSLHYETGDESAERLWCVLTFVPDEEATPAVLVADDELRVPQSFDMSAVPATP